jgi:hypothetical protein
MPLVPAEPSRQSARRRAARAARRRAIRRRRFVALAILVLIVLAIAFLTIRGCASGDPFVGTWRSTAAGASSSLVIANVQGSDYTVKVVGGKKTLTATRSGDTLTVHRAPPAKGVRMTLTPGNDANTLKESFPNGTTAVLTRQ